MPIGRESSTLSRPTTPRCITYLSTRHRSCRPTYWRATPRTTVPSPPTSRAWRVRVECVQLTTTSFVLLVRNRTLPPIKFDKPNSVGRAACLVHDKPIHIYAPLLMRSRIIQLCYSTASCHLGTRRTLCMLERSIGGLTRLCAPGGGFAG